MHIIKWELKAQSKGLIIWCVVMVVLIIMMTSEFSAYYNNPEMSDLLNTIPEQMLKAFSMDNANLTTTTGYLSLVSFYFYLILGVFAVLLGSSIISKEERDKTAEYLMTLPVSRQKVLFSKLVTAVICCVILLSVTVIAIILTLFKYDLDGVFYKYLMQLALTMLMIQLIFLSIGMCMASILKRYKNSGKISATVLMILYFLNIITALSESLDFLKYATPFRYFDTNKILATGTFEPVYFILSFIIICLGIAGTFTFYPKRDLHL